MSLPETTALEVDLASGWLTVRFNQPEMRNALTAELAADLRAVLLAVRDDRSVRGITFRGNGGTFCAGGDLKTFQAVFQGAANRDTVVEFSRKAGELLELLDSMPQVTVMAVEGAAMAGGFGLACAGDVVISTADARFALTETQLGVTPAQIIPYIVRRLGPGHARRLLLVGERIGADVAASVGLVNQVVADASALDAAVDAVKRLVLRCAPGAVAVTKELFRATLAGTSPTTIDRAAGAFADCLLSAEGLEGIAAFAERRKPSWAPRD